MDIKELNLKNVKFPAYEYFPIKHKKSQIYLHHTASGPSAHSVWNWWKNDKGRIATCVVIGADGEILQGFSSKYWAYHLGLATKHFSALGLPYKKLDPISIGIEVCCWGQLTEKNGKFYNYVNQEVPEERVCKLDKPYKGFQYYEDYTDAQIESVRKLLLLWHETYNIPITYNEDIFELNERALSGVPGVYTHNSVRPDKVDMYPNPKLIAMLKTL